MVLIEYSKNSATVFEEPRTCQKALAKRYIDHRPFNESLCVFAFSLSFSLSPDIIEISIGIIVLNTQNVQ